MNVNNLYKCFINAGLIKFKTKVNKFSDFYNQILTANEAIKFDNE